MVSHTSSATTFTCIISNNSHGSKHACTRHTYHTLSSVSLIPTPCASKAFTTLRCPFWHATVIGVYCNRASSVIKTCLASVQYACLVNYQTSSDNIHKQASWIQLEAMWGFHAVMSACFDQQQRLLTQQCDGFQGWGLQSAPNDSSSYTTSTWPSSAAHSSGVRPCNTRRGNVRLINTRVLILAANTMMHMLPN